MQIYLQNFDFFAKLLQIFHPSSRIFAIKCYYDQNGKFLDSDWYEDVYPQEDNVFNGWYWNGEEQRPASVKLVLLDMQSVPLCPCGHGTFEVD